VTKPHITTRGLRQAALRALDVGVQTQAVAQPPVSPVAPAQPEPHPKKPNAREGRRAVRAADGHVHALPRIVNETQSRAERVTWRSERSDPPALPDVRPLSPAERAALDVAEAKYSSDRRRFNSLAPGVRVSLQHDRTTHSD